MASWLAEERGCPAFLASLTLVGLHQLNLIDFKRKCTQHSRYSGKQEGLSNLWDKPPTGSITWIQGDTSMALSTYNHGQEQGLHLISHSKSKAANTKQQLSYSPTPQFTQTVWNVISIPVSSIFEWTMLSWSKTSDKFDFLWVYKGRSCLFFLFFVIPTGCLVVWCALTRINCWIKLAHLFCVDWLMSWCVMLPTIHSNKQTCNADLIFSF